MTNTARTGLLPPAICHQIQRVTNQARAGREPGPELAVILETLGNLSVNDRIPLTAQIQEVGQLYAQYGETVAGAGWHLGARAATRERECAALARTPWLSHLYIFHGDGYLREAALDAWPAAPASTLMLATIADRLNDWVPEVRAAARRCAAKWFPTIASEIVAEAFSHLVERQHRLQRWSPVEQKIMEDALYRPDVLQAVAQRLRHQTTGPASRILRSALRRDILDTELPILAREAALPSVRAVALETLLRGRARWRIGRKEEWIDKRYGQMRWVPDMAERPLSISTEPLALMRAHAGDRAPLVRKTVAAALIDRLETRQPDERTALREIAEKLAGDRSAPVARKARYFLQHTGPETPGQA